MSKTLLVAAAAAILFHGGNLHADDAPTQAEAAKEAVLTPPQPAAASDNNAAKQPNAADPVYAAPLVAPPSQHPERARVYPPQGGLPLQTYPGHWQPGYYGQYSGSPYFYNTHAPVGGLQRSRVSTYTAGADPYTYHFGPGFYRHSEHGHYRFPYYSYRRPWYYPGFAGYNRDTNLPW